MIEFIIFIVLKMMLLEEKTEILRRIAPGVSSKVVSNEIHALIKNLDKMNKNQIHSKIIIYTLEHLIECVNNRTVDYQLVDNINNQVQIALRRSGIF